jgi:hypothetical protein
LPRGKRIRPKPRSPKEFARIYRGPEFVFFCKAVLLCATCGEERPDFAHRPNGTAGTGRKGDAEGGVPLCRRCHDHQHDLGWPAFERLHDDVNFGLVSRRALERFESPDGQAYVALCKADGRFDAWLRGGDEHYDEEWSGDPDPHGPPSTYYNGDPRDRGYYP